MVLFKLAISNLRVRKVRMALTVSAIALSVSLVVAVTSGYKSMEGAALRYLNQYMGAADAVITAASQMEDRVPERFVGLLKEDPDVRSVVGRLESDRDMERAPDQIKEDKSPDRIAAGGTPGDKISVDLVGVRRPEDRKTDSLEMIHGQWFEGATGDFVVIDQIAAEKLGVHVGDSVRIPGVKQLTLKVVGEIHKPTFLAQRSATMYAPLETLQHFTGDDNPPQVTRISIDLRAGVNFDAFKDRWTTKLAELNPNITLHMRRDNAGELEKNLRGVRILSYLGGAIAMLTATFIIFSALSMGVTERQRTLAMLRAVGAIRSQVFRLVVLEGITLAIVGVLAGIPLGMLWMGILYLKFSDLFSAGPMFSLGGMLFASAGSIITALAASILPAWWASRVSPLDAMNSHSAPTITRPPFRWALVGLALACIDPILFFGPVEPALKSLGAASPDTTSQTIRFVGHFVAGLPGIMVGFFLMAPLFVWTVERVVSPILAAILRVPLALLRQQLSTGIWRAAGTAAALMVGLATLIAMQVQGHTLIGGWQLPTRFPDIFIWSSDPLSWADQKTLGTIPGIEPGTVMPVVVTTPAGDSKTTLFMAAALSGKNLSMMFFAVDPEQALSMIQLDFRDNNGAPLPADQQAMEEKRVAQEMKKGRRIIVTDEFRQLHHCKIGDPFPIITTLNGRQNYTIAGIVWSPGADVIISMFDLGRLLDQQTAGSVFGSIADAKRDFGVTGARLFGANLRGGIDKEALLKSIQAKLGDRGLNAGDVRHIKYAIESAFYRLLNFVSTVAIAAMAVASLGVANTVMASVRSRRWQFGVLRSIGLERGDLLRLILAEATMLGIVGVLLGLASGLEISMDARRLSGAVLGYAPPMQIPWGIVAGGCLALVGIALAASLWPAMSVARAEPLQLLQAGRAST